jgi:hypothetical protein
VYVQVGYNYFRLHPKGVGLVCKRQGGLPPLTFVEEYFGEIHTPWRWFEIQVLGSFVVKIMHCTNKEPWPAHL